ncbi:hypothetical protein BJ742DRAFT_765385 [Cladochytrium replicatum]|nr:hypothetical protein BJ742DRAFT_765385 [Cladochytrium replicatum]
MLNVAIIGAGPAALTAVVSIAKHCPASAVHVAVYESRASFKEHVGVQNTLASIGLNALDVLGMRDKLVEKAGTMNQALLFVDQAFGEETRAARREDEEVQLERVKFIEVLADEVRSQKVEIHFSKRFVKYDVENRKVVFEDRSSANAGLLFGANGIHSRVR